MSEDTKILIEKFNSTEAEINEEFNRCKSDDIKSLKKLMEIQEQVDALKIEAARFHGDDILNYI